MAKILLVEDQELNRDMLSRRQKKRGHEVSVAVDGAEGLEKALAEGPELILMDIDDGTRGTDREKALEAGCDAYETKPVELPRLLETMDQLLAAAARAR